MSDAEIAEWVKLLNAGGNAGIIVLCFIAVKVASAFLSALKSIVTTMQENHAAEIAGQEDIKRAIVALDPKTAALFRKVGGT